MPFPTFFFAVCIDVDDQTQFINEYFLHFILQDFRPDGQLRNGECSLQDVSFSYNVFYSVILENMFVSHRLGLSCMF